MIEQQGRVLRVEAGRASITFQAVSGCPACDAGKGCGAGVFGRLVQRKPMTLVLDEQPGLTPGQAVMVGIPEAYFLRLLVKLYLAPVLAGLAGAILGHYLAMLWSLQGFALDLAALAGALIFAAVALHSPMAGKGKVDGGRPMVEPALRLMYCPGIAGNEEFRQHCQSATD